VGHVSLRTSSAVVVERFADVPELGRFVLVRRGETVAGGIVTGLTGERS
jgi:translation elongation factor EF-1alpha